MRIVKSNSIRFKLDNSSNFTGTVHTSTYVDETMAEHLRLTLVRFEPGAKTRWHRHEFEQGLVITAGRGVLANDLGRYYIAAGDVIVVPAGERHWHGAAPDEYMAHISIVTPGETEWLEEVAE